MRYSRLVAVLALALTLSACNFTTRTQTITDAPLASGGKITVTESAYGLNWNWTKLTDFLATVGKAYAASQVGGF